jgi:hypothetical protein
MANVTVCCHLSVRCIRCRDNEAISAADGPENHESSKFSPILRGLHQRFTQFYTLHEPGPDSSFRHRTFVLDTGDAGAPGLTHFFSGADSPTAVGWLRAVFFA